MYLKCCVLQLVRTLFGWLGSGHISDLGHKLKWRRAKAGSLSQLGQTIINIATVTERGQHSKYLICKRFKRKKCLLVAMHLTVRTSDLSLFMTLSNDYIINARYYVHLCQLQILAWCLHPTSRMPKKATQPCVHCALCALCHPNSQCTVHVHFSLLVHTKAKFQIAVASIFSLGTCK